MTAAAILAIGDEVVLGDRPDTNGPWLAGELAARGISVTQRRQVADDQVAIAAAIGQLASDADLVVTCGGLGPTGDDRTRAALAAALGEELQHDEWAMASIEAWFAQRSEDMPEPNRCQALRPTSATAIANAHGTAPGMRAVIGDARILCLPGPPSELRPMFEGCIDELLNGLKRGDRRIIHEVTCWGLPESLAAERIADLIDDGAAILMGAAGISARVIGDADMAAEIRQRWAPFALDRSLPEDLGVALAKRSATLATAESCTGGMLGSLVVSVSGSSAWYRGGWVTYDNDLKVSELGVDAALIEAHGAVSGEVAAEMAIGAAQRADADAALSISGIAGPDGGSDERPVGTVFIGCMLDGAASVTRFCFSGDRRQVRQRAARSALQVLRLRMLGAHDARQCWQEGVPIGP